MASDKKKIEVTVVLPAYNEEGVIGDTVRKIKSLHPDFEVLVVDDGSSDNTMEEAVDAGANVWPHPYNIGNGAAVKTGLRCAQGEWIVLMDADGQHDPGDISRLVAEKDSYDMVVGARSKGSKTSLHRNIANWVYNRFASYVTNFKIDDLTSGFRLIRASIIRQYIYLLPNTFSYPTTITMAYLRSGRSIKYIPIKSLARKGKSKIKIVKDGTRFLLIITKIATLFAPMRIFLPISVLFFLIGFAYYLFTYLTQGRFTNMSLLLLNSSVIIFLMGLVSEQISQARYDKIE